MSAATYEEFEATQRREDYPPPQELLSALKKLVTDSSTPIEKIAKEAAAPWINNTTEEYPDFSLLWRTLLEAINAFQDHNDKFVDFVLALTKLPDGDGVFKDLPEFDQHFTEFALAMQDFRNDELNREARRQGQVNEHAFMAKLSSRGHGQNCLPIDELVRSGFVFRSTCEFAPWEKVNFPDIDDFFDEGDDEEEWREYRDRELELHSIKILNIKVPAAYHWLKHEGDRIYRLQGPMNGEYEWQNEALQVKWTGEQGYSKERFAFWRERFEWMTKVTALEHSTQRLAKECAELMQAIEEKQQ
ncbi:hypothetical protein DM02DRAFT_641888 [Periconia macrospinosa]|uniref:Uncharacterized protein n=1 Tax=Periconia macrospinosa TaxID=97972 RepID=A0A2V1DSZ1_9PLEO|nr:hypothetical protein DM02DRAFT_641888 [Periconia macrospinosa]